MDLHQHCKSSSCCTIRVNTRYYYYYSDCLSLFSDLRKWRREHNAKQRTNTVRKKAIYIYIYAKSNGIIYPTVLLMRALLESLAVVRKNVHFRPAKCFQHNVTIFNNKMWATNYKKKAYTHANHIQSVFQHWTSHFKWTGLITNSKSTK